MYCNADSECDLLSSKFVQTVHKRLECAVCKDKYSSHKIPRRLHCDHSFCEGCLEQLITFLQIKCPTCRESTRVSYEGVTGLKKNLDLLGFVDDVTEAAAKKPQFAICETHQKPMELFCKTDKKLICTLCIHTMEHRGHEYFTLQEQVEHLTKEAERQFSKKEDLEKNIYEADMKLMLLQSASQSGKKESLQKIEAEKKMSMKVMEWMYDQRKRNIEKSNDEVSRICEVKMEENNWEKEYIEDKRKKLESLKKLTKSKLDKAVPALEQFIAEMEKKEITVQEKSEEDEKKVLTFNYSSNEFIQSPMRVCKAGIPLSSWNSKKPTNKFKKGSAYDYHYVRSGRNAEISRYSLSMPDASAQGTPVSDEEISSIVKLLAPFKRQMEMSN